MLTKKEKRDDLLNLKDRHQPIIAMLATATPLREIAKICHCHFNTVSRVKRSLEAQGALNRESPQLEAWVALIDTKVNEQKRGEILDYLIAEALHTPWIAFKLLEWADMMTGRVPKVERGDDTAPTLRPMFSPEITVNVVNRQPVGNEPKAINVTATEDKG